MVKLLHMSPPNPIGFISYVARVSTGTAPKSYDEECALVKRIINMGHFSCLEFGEVSFEVVCSRAASHQIVRHRHFSFMQESQRRVAIEEFDLADTKTINEIYDYVKQTHVIPESIKHNISLLTLVLKHISDTTELYKVFVDNGVRKEDARYILPNSQKTRLIIKGNFRSWYEFLEKRLHKAAQWEIRKIAREIADIVIKNVPVVFDKFKLEEDKKDEI